MQETPAFRPTFMPELAAERVLLAGSALATLLLLGWVVSLGRYGFDYTDDAFYLIWIARPFDYAASSSQFGFAYHPLHLLVDGNIAALRAAGFLLSFLFGAAATWAMLRKVFGAGGPAPATRLAVSAGLGSLALLYTIFAGEWLPSPSYNSLALQGALVTATGLCLADATWSRSSLAGWVLGGVGLWLAFLGKPTTAAALVVFVAAYFLATRGARLSQFMLAGAIGAALLLLTAVAIDGSLAGFIRRQAEGLELGKLLGGGHTVAEMFRLERAPRSWSSDRLSLLLAAGLLLGLGATQWRPARHPTAGLLLGAALSVGAVLLALRSVPLSLVRGTQWPVLILPPALAVVAAGLAIAGHEGRRNLGRKDVFLAVAMLCFPYAYAFGSGSSYWSAFGSAWVFVLLACLAVLGPLGPRPRLGGMLLVVALSLQVLLAAMIQQAIASPYRQPQALRKHDVVVPVAASELVLSQADARYLLPMQQAAQRHGFQRGTPVIDLSGRAPGLLYAIGGRNAGLAWNLSGYPGSAAYTRRGLQGETCEALAGAWVVTQSAGPIPPIPPAVLASFGADLQRDFLAVGTAVSPVGQVQTLHKPVRPVAEAVLACESAREAQP